MKMKRLIPIAVLASLCLLSPAIGTYISKTLDIVPDDFSIARISNYAWGIRTACLILAMYFVFEKE